MSLSRNFLRFFVPSAWDVWPFLAAWSGTFATSAYLIVGMAQQIPWATLLPDAALTFGGVSAGLFYFSEWQQKRSVVSKLNFAHPRVSLVAGTNAICLGFQLKSNAEFPIQCEVVEIKTRVTDRVPMETANLPRRFTVPPYGFIFYDAHQIEFEPSRVSTVEGHIEFEVRYGRTDNFTEILTGAKTVYLTFDADGNLSASPAWVDVTD